MNELKDLFDSQQGNNMLKLIVCGNTYLKKIEQAKNPLFKNIQKAERYYFYPKWVWDRSG